jgi:hypothetical protein
MAETFLELVYVNNRHGGQDYGCPPSSLKLSIGMPYIGTTCEDGSISARSPAVIAHHHLIPHDPWSIGASLVLGFCALGVSFAKRPTTKNRVFTKRTHF